MKNIFNKIQSKINSLTIRTKTAVAAAVDNTRAEGFVDTGVKIIIAVDAFVPEWFIESEDDRLKLITEISALESQKSAQEFLNNLESTLGKVPNEVQNLAKISVLKNLCQKVGARQVQVNEDGFKL